MPKNQKTQNPSKGSGKKLTFKRERLKQLDQGLDRVRGGLIYNGSIEDSGRARSSYV